MTEFQNKSFSVYPGKDGGQKYRDNWDTIFGKKEKAEPVAESDPCTCGTQCNECHMDGCPAITVIP